MAANTRKAAEEASASLFEKIRNEVKGPEPLKVTDEITLYCPTNRQIRDSQKAANEEEQNRILIGEHYDALYELFLDLSPHAWAEFLKAYTDHFFELRPAQ